MANEVYKHFRVRSLVLVSASKKVQNA